MNLNVCGDRRHDKSLRAWQLALLRFAITMDNADRLALLAIAAELDAPGARPFARPAFKFFHKASAELCQAIVNPQLPGSEAVLQRHLKRCDDDRLKRAFAAVLAIDTLREKPPARPPAPPSVRGPITTQPNHAVLSDPVNMIHSPFRIGCSAPLHRAYEFEAAALSNSYAVFLIFDASEERAVWSLQ